MLGDLRKQTVIDPLFGEIAYTEPCGWEGICTFFFLGREVTVPLALGGWDENDAVEPVQRDAFEQFILRKEKLCALADDALCAHYLERQPELREQFGDSADRLMPIIAGKQDLTRLVTPDFLLVANSLRASNDRVVALLYNCTWAVDLGLAVKFVNECVNEVGAQNLVL
ncbi:DUF6985 domain-containing protein [Mycobacteroides chelonae]|uniref:DUF6985 domain-containing protein n=1 Tax=Mycobacteroides chelonae TaxID=1774 RepID=UPI003AADB322